MQVSEAELKSMLAEAYERGWRGFLEGGEDCVAEIVSSFRSRVGADPYRAVTTTTASPYCNSNVTEPYYFYSSLTLAPPQNGGRGDIV